MPKKQLTDQQVEEILDSLSGMEKAEPRPFFYTRLQARMAKEADNSAWGRTISLVSRPAVAFSAVVLFLLMNGYFLFNKFGQQPPPSEETYQALAVEYSEMNSPFYEVNQENP
jgi:hypothetical protein